MYMPELGNFPNNKVKLNHAVNIAIAPSWTTSKLSSKLCSIVMRRMYSIHVTIVNISNKFETELENVEK